MGKYFNQNIKDTNLGVEKLSPKKITVQRKKSATDIVNSVLENKNVNNNIPK